MNQVILSDLASQSIFRLHGEKTVQAPPKIAADVTPKEPKIYEIQRRINAQNRLREMHTNNVDNGLDDVV